MIKYDSETNHLKIFDLDNTRVPGSSIDYHTDVFRLDKLDQEINVGDIDGFIYGSFSSRFWMMRIGMNQLLLENSERANRISRKKRNE